MTFTATPDGGYIVDKWLLNGVVVQAGGVTYTLYNVTGNETVQVVFKLPGRTPQYTITDLGTLGGNESHGFGINNAGQVTGKSATADGYMHAFLYSGGIMTDLGGNVGYGINNAGQVTGFTGSHAFLYSGGIMTDLGGYIGYGINDAGQVTGTRFISDGILRAFLYSEGSVLDLSTLGVTDSTGTSINNAGQVVGYSAIAGDGANRAFLYSDGTMYNLNDLIGSGPNAIITHAYGINDLGQIVANGYADGYSHTYLLTPAPDASSPPAIRGQVAGEPDGTRYVAFSTAQVGAFLATISSGKTAIPAVIGPDRTVLLRVGGGVPALGGSVISRLGQPSGDAVLATLKLNAAEQITAKNNVVLLRGLNAGVPQVAARTGTANAALPAGVTFKSFGTIDGNGSDIFFFATLQGTGVTPGNALALCAALADGSVKVLARVGDQVAGKKIATIGTLVGSTATLAEGRWRVDDTTCGVRLTFADAAKSQAIYAIPATALSPADWTPLAQTGVVSNIAAINGAKIVSFGLPGFGQGPSASVIANLAIVPGGPTAANHFALIKGTFGANSIVLARTGDTIAVDANGAPLTGTKIASFLDPVAGTGGRVAFAVSMIRPGGLVSRGIMSRRAGQTPALLANVGAQAPGGGRWSALGALALPDGADSGPVFLGTLAVNTAGGVTTKNNAGLWGVDSTGTLRLLLRTGQPVTIGAATKALKSFVGLVAAPGSIGAASTFDNEGRIAIHATCTDGTRALMVVEIP